MLEYFSSIVLVYQIWVVFKRERIWSSAFLKLQFALLYFRMVFKCYIFFFNGLECASLKLSLVVISLISLV